MVFIKTDTDLSLSSPDKAYGEVEAYAIHAGYGKKEILQGVSFSSKKGEILALIGPNGAGKSTLLKVLAGFLKPTEGSVHLYGYDVTNLPPYERVKHGLAYLIQGGKVFPSLTVQENLAMGAFTVPSENRKENLKLVVDLFPRLKELFNRRAGLLSGGERQALALGMVLMQNPKVLLLDEPSAGLSPKLVQEILEKIKKINEEWKISVLLVEQNVRGALSIAHRVIALANGKLVLETDEPEKLLAQGALEKLFLGLKPKERGN